MTDDERRLRELIVRLTGCIAGDDDGCAWTGTAERLARAVEALIDTFADLVPDPDEGSLT